MTEPISRCPVPMRRFLDVVGGRHPVRERAMALVDACTWPELITFHSAPPALATYLAEALGAIPDTDPLLQALTTEEIGLLLTSPIAPVRTWVMTAVLSRRTPLPDAALVGATTPSTRGAVRPSVAPQNPGAGTTPAEPDREEPVVAARRPVRL